MNYRSVIIFAVTCSVIAILNSDVAAQQYTEMYKTFNNCVCKFSERKQYFAKCLDGLNPRNKKDFKKFLADNGFEWKKSSMKLLDFICKNLPEGSDLYVEGFLTLYNKAFDDENREGDRDNFIKHAACVDATDADDKCSE